MENVIEFDMSEMCIENGGKYLVKIGDRRPRIYVGIVDSSSDRIMLVAKYGRVNRKPSITFIGGEIPEVIRGRDMQGRPNGLDVQIRAIG